jgi:hypothetical protein
MKYARLYDGTVAQHYYQAMGQIEGYLNVDVNVQNPVVRSLHRQKER